MEVINRFKGLDLIDRVPHELRMEVCDIVQRQGSKPSPWERNVQHRQNNKKQRYYFADKGPSGKAMDFPVVMYGCENWTIKKAER